MYHLLGADDKAVIAIMTAPAHLRTPGHQARKIAILLQMRKSAGADYFDVEGFGADFAYTVDGGLWGT